MLLLLLYGLTVVFTHHSFLTFLLVLTPLCFFLVNRTIVHQYIRRIQNCMDAAAHTLRCVGDFNTTKVGIELLYMCMCQLRDSANEHAEEDLKRSAERDSAQFEEDDEDEEEDSARRRVRIERDHLYATVEKEYLRLNIYSEIMSIASLAVQYNHQWSVLSRACRNESGARGSATDGARLNLSFVVDSLLAVKEHALATRVVHEHRGSNTTQTEVRDCRWLRGLSLLLLSWMS